MNRTYKVIWSKARRCYVVVSELAKSQHKSSSKSEHISSNVHGRGYLGKAAAAAVVASLLTFSGLVYSPVMAAGPDANSNTDTKTNGTDNDCNAKIVKSSDDKISIVIGDNQNIGKIEESIVIGSLSSDEQKETDRQNHPYKYMVGRNSIILGNHASNTLGESVVVGNRSQANGNFQTIMGHRSIIKGYADQQEGGNRAAENYGALSSIYGAFNTIESA